MPDPTFQHMDLDGCTVYRNDRKLEVYGKAPKRADELEVGDVISEDQAENWWRVDGLGKVDPRDAVIHVQMTDADLPAGQPA